MPQYLSHHHHYYYQNHKVLKQKGQKKKEKGKYGKRLSGTVKRAMKAEKSAKKNKK